MNFKIIRKSYISNSAIRETKKLMDRVNFDLILLKEKKNIALKFQYKIDNFLLQKYATNNLTNLVFNIDDICYLIISQIKPFKPLIVPNIINKVFYKAYRDYYKKYMTTAELDYQGKNLQLFNNNKGVRNITGNTIRNIVCFGPYLTTNNNYKIIVSPPRSKDFYIGFTMNDDSDNISLIGILNNNGDLKNVVFPDYKCLSGFSGPDLKKQNINVQDQYLVLLIRNKRPIVYWQDNTPQNIQLYRRNRCENPPYDITLSDITRLWIGIYDTHTSIELVKIEIM